MAFETDVHCDRCGETLYYCDISTKTRMTIQARKKGWTMGKYHLCPKCKGKIKQHKKDGWLN